MSKDQNVLTVQDTIDKLTEMVKDNPEAADYQLAESIYDDWAIEASLSLFPLRRFSASKIPESNEDLYVSEELTSDGVLIFPHQYYKLI